MKNMIPNNIRKTAPTIMTTTTIFLLNKVLLYMTRPFNNITETNMLKSIIRTQPHENIVNIEIIFPHIYI